MNRYTTGWLPELPDIRDWDANEIFGPCSSTPLDHHEPTITTWLDWREFCSPIEHQGSIGSCTAQAVAGLVEFQERVQFGRHMDVSRLFLYKVARHLDGFKGDSGAHIRTAMKGLAIFGAPPERYWPYNPERFDRNPGGFVYCYGQNLQAITYWRLDIGGRPRDDVLRLAKTLLASKKAIAFGFRVYSYGNDAGEFPVPDPGARPQGGHAVLAVGYDDARRIGESIGALLIRNSWGKSWGADGYGWLPYEYVTRGLASDFWTLQRKETLV